MPGLGPQAICGHRAIVAGDTLLVGFNETTYADLFG